ncbi:hypothetical protein A2U01_0022593 [Trifolium medium]|uniref:Uncharacterized protein n=1 Tax=Trifolium medium TaxID=97028 RepID=A0A392NR62_9FABA|nr:hypothetical protein [Trifolium medium]
MGGKIHRRLFGERRRLSRQDRLLRIQDLIDEKRIELDQARERLRVVLYKRRITRESIQKQNLLSPSEDDEIEEQRKDSLITLENQLTKYNNKVQRLGYGVREIKNEIADLEVEYSKEEEGKA